ncbi:hypothetical protein ACL2XP_09305 [Sodalis sp. RH21]|uniref:GntT/GntP/DsdX family permease n=1 Tax=unclassified Sodalis (in: enterobacteria) TaxID=2636512 RepID=UPI0039B683CE
MIAAVLRICLGSAIVVALTTARMVAPMLANIIVFPVALAQQCLDAHVGSAGRCQG